MHPLRGDIVRITISVLLICSMIGACAWILRPFLAALIWAAMTVIATWPLMISLERKLWHRRGLATAVMVLIFLVFFFLPLSFALATIIDNTDQIVNWIKSLGSFATPHAPHWLKDLPYVGDRLSERWEELATTPEELRSRLIPYAGSLLRWLVAQIGSFGSLLLNFLLTVVISAILYLKGEKAGAGITAFARSIAGARGEDSIRLAAQAVRAVATGVIITAAVQAALAWAGLAVSGVPYPGLLTAAAFLLAVSQIGPGPVLFGAVIWLYLKGDPAWAVGLLLWAILVGLLDSFLRPVFIKRSGNISLLLILPGVIGGIFAFGLIGIFIGPVVLAVAYTLIAAWVTEGDPESTLSRTE